VDNSFFDTAFFVKDLCPGMSTLAELYTVDEEEYGPARHLISKSEGKHSRCELRPRRIIIHTLEDVVV
jgi:hypothetical protein